MNQSKAHGAAWLAINRERPKEHKVIGSVNFMNQSGAQTKYAEFRAKIKATEKPQLIGMAVGLERLQLKNDLNHFRSQCADEGITLLEPCPFCGSYTVAVFTDFGYKKLAWVSCGYCNTTGPDKSTEIGAIAAWNTRIN